MKGCLLLIALFAITSACGPSPEAAAASTATAAAWTATPSPSSTPTITLTPTLTATPTITLTPTVTATPTFAFPSAIVNKQAHCRYGPSTAYLHAADLYAGDMGTVRGRHEFSTWLYIKFDKLDYFCWAAPSVVDVTGDVGTLYLTKPDLPSIGRNQYGPPKGVYAVRDGDQVTIHWNQVVMTQDKDRGYFIEAFVCQNGYLLWWTASFPDQYTTSYTVQDEAGCPEASSGQLYTVEKHGYSQPVAIPWPAP
jgi:hypothetical protein